jgi:murein DD-endopeptidase MepM/ murein hydrolase activator NlpD
VAVQAAAADDTLAAPAPEVASVPVDDPTPLEFVAPPAVDETGTDEIGTGEREPLAEEAPESAPARPRWWHRRPPAGSRRPALHLAAALVGALAVGTAAAAGPAAHADTGTVSESVSVADQLGITAQSSERAVPDVVAGRQLQELVVSRHTRDAEQAVAADAQRQADQAAAAAAAEAARPKAVSPVNGARLTSTFGPRWGTMHAGIDLAAPMHTPEYAVMDGVVLEAGPASGFGLAVYIQHENGDVTVYGHMDQILVTAGQVVRAGDQIALLGNRGQSTGPHLHFEVHVGGVNGQKIDPIPWLAERGVQV